MNSILANDRLRLSLTDSCNFSCPYCTNEGQQHNGGNFLRLDFVKNLANKIKEEEIFIRKLNITRGEPLLHPHLYEIITLCRKITDSLTLNTNGNLLNKKKILQMHQLGIDNIKFGLDSFFQSFTKPTIKSVRCNPKKIIQNLFYSIELMPRSSINCVLTDFNFNEIDLILDYIIKHNINWVEFLELIEFDFRGSNITSKPGPKFSYILKNHKSLFKEITYNRKLGKFICFTMDDLMVQFAEDFCLRRVCQNLWTRINCNGFLLPCIKSKEGIPINFSNSLTEQIEKSNKLMCNSSSSHFPRDYFGNLLKNSSKGDYIVPNMKDFLELNVKDTVLDP